MINSSELAAIDQAHTVTPSVIKMQSLLKSLANLILSCVLLHFIVSCADKSKKSPTEYSSKSETENFDLFYDKFVSDSLFQLSRVKFPLEGHYIDGFKRENWKKENWKLMRNKIYDIDSTQYKISLKKENTYFKGKVWIDNSGFYIEFIFKLIAKKWYLVYYLNQNL